MAADMEPITPNSIATTFLQFIGLSFYRQKGAFMSQRCIETVRFIQLKLKNVLISHYIAV